ncbi:MAG: hypothetical protein Q9220_002520 [cf. Caloplaca sp. 1 TL-2023]
MAPLQIDQEAATLVAELAGACSDPNDFGSFSPTVYDTAWVSMIVKKEPGAENFNWRFPECFQYLLHHQHDDGSWAAYATEVDCILNTLAGLLALKVHADAPQNGGSRLPADIERRISNASSAATKMLQDWDVNRTVHVGFEILVPALLRLLDQKGFSFSMPGERALRALNKKKLKRFDSRMLRGQTQLTLLHSLEAFIGMIDFDQVKHHKRHGSMMNSPSSTAAYLMYSSTWDDEAEDYLDRVVSALRDQHSGGVPSAYPTSTFMIAWATSSLLSSGFETSRLGGADITRIANYLEEQLAAGQGLVGFAPGVLEDADDTARAIISLRLLGRQFSPDGMIKQFENGNHFKTYSSERNPSFSANCNILIALTYASHPTQYATAISKATQYLCDAWDEGAVNDKWNLSPLYSEMLLSQALVRLLYLWDQGQLNDTVGDLVQNKVPLVLCQITTSVLQRLEAPSLANEAVSYGILALTQIGSLPWLELIRSKIAATIETCQKTLLEVNQSSTEADYLWVEKVTFGSPILSRAYRLAAQKASISQHTWGDRVESLVSFSTKTMIKSVKFFSQLPLFSLQPEWKLQTSVIESQLFYPKLKRASRSIFPRKDMAKDDYLNYIPTTWTMVNICRDTPFSANMLWEMMILSMLNYQADEYMEAVVGERFKDDLRPVSTLIRHICQHADGLVKEQMVGSSAGQTNGNHMPPKKRRHSEINGDASEQAFKKPHTNANHTTKTPVLDDIAETLTSFVTHQISHPLVKASNPSDQRALIFEIQTFLLAHVTQIEDNARFSSQQKSSCSETSASDSMPTIIPYSDAQVSYFNWVRTTSADHTSCPYSFAYLSCLLGGAANIQRQAFASEDDPASSPQSCFPTAKSKYYSQALCRHLATMCRQYNDYGSVARDRAEVNLNSVNFPEFRHEDQEETLKKEVLELAEFEREGVVLAQKKLGKELDAEGKIMKGVKDAVGVFVDVTDLYGQIYVVRDIASRMK